MKNLPELDQFYFYKTKHSIPFTHRLQEDSGYKYVNNRAVVLSGDKEINIYHMSVEVDGITNGITVVTKNSDANVVEKEFKKLVVLLNENEELFKKFKSSKLSPSKSGISL